MTRHLANGIRLLLATVTLAGCAVLESPLLPQSGRRPWRQAGLVAVPGGTVDMAGGNLVLSRAELSIDTVFGPHEIHATHDAATGRWHWNFQMTFDGSTFVDDTGTAWDVSNLADGTPIPGSVWVKADSDTIEGRGRLAFHFDAQGVLSSGAWATLPYPRIEYSHDTAAITIAQCLGAGACAPYLAITTGAGGAPTSITDLRTGRVAELLYDPLGRLERARSPLDVEEGWPGAGYEYDALGLRVTATTSSEGERVEYAYDAEGRLGTATRIGEGDPEQVFEFHPAVVSGDLALWPSIHANPLGGRTRYLFDGLHRLHSVELEGTGEVTSFSWTGSEVRPDSITGPDDATTQLAWADDEIVSVTRPCGNVLVFDPARGALAIGSPFTRPIERVEDSLGQVEERTYDALGRVATSAGGDGATTTFTWNGALPASRTSPDGIRSDFPLYGVHGHWLERTGAVDDRRRFDLVGNPVVSSLIAKHGGVLASDYDANRRLSALDVAATEGSTVTHDDTIAVHRRSDGAITRIERPFGGDHEFVFDALGRVIEKRELSDGLWRTTTLEYDAAGNRTAVSLPNGMRRELDVDAYGRRTAVRAYSDGILESEATFTWQDGHLASMWDSVRATTTTYTYDAAGRLATATFGHGEAIAYEWDLRSRLISETFSMAGMGVVAEIRYGYDLADRRTSVTDAMTGEVLLARTFSGGRLVQKALGNGLVRTFSYDPATGIATGAETRDSEGQLVAESVVDLAGETNPVRQQVTNTVTTPLGTTAEEFWLGAETNLSTLDGLVGKRVFHWSDGGVAAEEFAYDELANRASDATGNTFTYNAERNRLLSATRVSSGTSVSFGYDEAGYVTSRDGAALSWTATGRLASHGSDVFEWDALGAPISAAVAGATTRFDLFDGRVESDAQTGALAWLAVANEVSVHVGTGAVRYRHFDFRSNVSFLSDGAGQITDHFRYGPYGLDAALGAGGNATTFAGSLEVGPLMLMGARIYDPLVGRFLSPDPILQLQNQYTWTFGNPVLFADASGLGAFSIAQWGQDLQSAGMTIIEFSVVAVGVGAGTATVFPQLGGGLVASGIVLFASGTITAALGSAILFFADPTPLPPVQEPGPGGPPPTPIPGPDVEISIDPEDEIDQSLQFLGGSGVGNGPGVGGSGSCGLLGLEAVLAVAWVLRRRRRLRGSKPNRKDTIEH